MRINLDALSTELYNAVSNWNDFTENEDGDRILLETEVGNLANSAFNLITLTLEKEGSI